MPDNKMDTTKGTNLSREIPKEHNGWAGAQAFHERGMEVLEREDVELFRLVEQTDIGKKAPQEVVSEGVTIEGRWMTRAYVVGPLGPPPASRGWGNVEPLRLRLSSRWLTEQVLEMRFRARKHLRLQRKLARAKKHAGNQNYQTLQEFDRLSEVESEDWKDREVVVNFATLTLLYQDCPKLTKCEPFHRNRRKEVRVVSMEEQKENYARHALDNVLEGVLGDVEIDEPERVQVLEVEAHVAPKGPDPEDLEREMVEIGGNFARHPNVKPRKELKPLFRAEMVETELKLVRDYEEEAANPIYHPEYNMEMPQYKPKDKAAFLSPAQADEDHIVDKHLLGKLRLEALFAVRTPKLLTQLKLKAKQELKKFDLSLYTEDERCQLIGQAVAEAYIPSNMEVRLVNMLSRSETRSRVVYVNNFLASGKVGWMTGLRCKIGWPFI